MGKTRILHIEWILVKAGSWPCKQILDKDDVIESDNHTDPLQYGIEYRCNKKRKVQAPRLLEITQYVTFKV